MSVDSACVRTLEAAAQVEAAAWLQGGSRACDQYPGEDEPYSERGACSFILRAF
jgi:hypothetical protein